jgi:hypothetical protein
LRRADASEARLHELAARPEARCALHELLERTRDDNPLFDTSGFARDWDALLERAYAATLAAR